MTSPTNVNTSDTVPVVGKPKMVMRSLRVPETLWERAKDKADREDKNISDIVRELLTKWVDDES